MTAEDSSRKAQRRITPLAGLTAVLVAAVVAGCAVHDPTGDNFYVGIVNDTSHVVRLVTCGTDDGPCERTYLSDRFQPGESGCCFQTATSLVNVVLVEDDRERRVGCLPLYFDDNADGTTILVSRAVPCRKAYPIRKRSDKPVS